MGRKTQCEMIVDYVKLNGSITPKESMTFGCMRLAARIAELEKQGVHFLHEVYVESRGGVTVRYAKYSFL